MRFFARKSNLRSAFSDPLVREKVKLNTQGQIILLDEAHNIEDSCRDAASFCVLEEDLTDERNACEAAGEFETAQFLQ